MTAPSPTPLVEPLTLEALAAELNKTLAQMNDAQKVELDRHLRAAIRHVEKKHLVLPRQRIVSVELDRGRGLLPVWPVASIESAVDVHAAPVTLTPNEAGEVTSSTHSSGLVAVTVTVGYPAGTMPEDLALGILIIASHLYSVGQRVPGQDAARPGFGGGGAAAPSPGYAIPNRAATLLAPFMPPGTS